MYRFDARANAWSVVREAEAGAIAQSESGGAQPQPQRSVKRKSAVARPAPRHGHLLLAVAVAPSAAGGRDVDLQPSPRSSPRVNESAAGQQVERRTRLYLHGGLSGGEFFDDFWSFDVERGVWERVEPVGGNGRAPSARAAHGGVTLFPYLFVLGGLGAGNCALSDMHAFDCETRQWTAIAMSGAEMPARVDFAYALVWLPRSQQQQAAQGAERSDADDWLPALFVHGGMNTSGYIFDDAYLCALPLTAATPH